MSVHELKPGLYFWQWDTGQQLLISNDDCGEVHFCNGTDDCALVVPIKTEADGTRTAEVPNILLQTAKPIRAYLYRRHTNGATTRTQYIILVIERKRPADYVYTETEVKTWESLAEEIRAACVLVDSAQDLTEEQKAQARKNIGIDGGSGGLSITDDGEGNVTITSSGSVSITDDGNGNVVIA